MIVPSIDLEGGRCVQLRGGEELVIDAGDPHPIADRFGRVGEVAVIDLDAAKGQGEHRALIESLIDRSLATDARGIRGGGLRVGGGIRDYARACAWLDRGAAKVILGTAAEASLLRRLPKERVVAAVDGRDDRVVIEGWRRESDLRVVDRVKELREYVGGFLVTFVEGEGRLGGIHLDRVAALRDACGDARLTVAGGIRDASEVAELDRMGVDAQVGMALYSGRFGLADVFAAMLTSDRPDGLWPTIVCDEQDRALGLVYSNRESLERMLELGRGVYWSRRRGLWHKGESSGDVQELVDVRMDCDRDTLLVRVRQHGKGFCHLGSSSCFGSASGLAQLEDRLEARRRDAASAGAQSSSDASVRDEGSYSAKLFGDPALLGAKLREEADELARAQSEAEIAHEAADLVYFTMSKCVAHAVPWRRVLAVLDARALRVTRRPGAAKPPEAIMTRFLELRSAGSIKAPGAAFDGDALSVVSPIVESVRNEGLSAARRYGEWLGDLQAGERLMIRRDELEAALASIDADVRSILEEAADRIRRFAEAQLACLVPLETEVPGGRAGPDDSCRSRALAVMRRAGVTHCRVRCS